jgi:hypothetical protein
MDAAITLLVISTTAVGIGIGGTILYNRRSDNDIESNDGRRSENGIESNDMGNRNNPNKPQTPPATNSTNKSADGINKPAIVPSGPKISSSRSWSDVMTDLLKISQGIIRGREIMKNASPENIAKVADKFNSLLDEADKLEQLNAVDAKIQYTTLKSLNPRNTLEDINIAFGAIEPKLSNLVLKIGKWWRLPP